MKQKEKDLLLKDLCSRLTYGVKVKFGDSKPALLTVIEHDEFGWQIGSEDEFGGMITIIDNVKPYLFPLSSMTDTQEQEFLSVAGYERREEDCGRHTETYYYDMVGHEHNFYPNSDAIDWLIKNHFDIYGLIPMGLAIDATDKNIY